MDRAQRKSVRILQIEQFLLAQREPIAQAEIARRFEVNQSTITRTVRDMADAGIPIYEDEKGRIGINRESYLTSIRLNLDESMALYLAARLLARYSDKPNPHTVEALLKLGLALEQGVAPHRDQGVPPDTLRRAQGRVQEKEREIPDEEAGPQTKVLEGRKAAVVLWAKKTSAQHGTRSSGAPAVGGACMSASIGQDQVAKQRLKDAANKG